MSATATFWKRIEGLFRPRSVDLLSAQPRIGFLQPRAKLNGSTAQPHEPSHERSAGAPHAPARPGANRNGHAPPHDSPWARWRRRSAEARDSHRRTAELIEAIHEHLRRQEQRSIRAVELIERIEAAVHTLIHSHAGHGDALGRIDQRLEAGNAQAEKLAATLRDVPQALRNQAEAVQAVSGQLDASRTIDAEMMQSLGRFEQATAQLREAGAAQVDTLNRIQMDTRQERAALEHALRRQNRRFVLVSIACTLVSVVSITAIAVQAVPLAP